MAVITYERQRTFRPFRDFLWSSLKELWLVDFDEHPDERGLGIRDIFNEAKQKCSPLWPALRGRAPSGFARLSIEQRLFVTFVGICLTAMEIVGNFALMLFASIPLYGKPEFFPLIGSKYLLAYLRDASGNQQFEFVVFFVCASFAALALLCGVLIVLLRLEQSIFIGKVVETTEIE